MPRVLHVQASPRGWGSFSTRAAQAFLEAYRRKHPGTGVDLLDLFAADLPEFNAPQAAAKYAVLSGQEPADDAARAWKRIIEITEHFKSADMYVLSCPMWNFAIPYRLKQYIDIIVQPGLTFSYSPQEGYKGLVTGKPAVLILARGGEYGPGNASQTFDFQGTYLEAVLGFIGFTDIRPVIVEPTLAGGPDAAEKALQRAIQAAKALADSL